MPKQDPLAQLKTFVEKLLDPDARDVFVYLFETGKEVTENEIAEATGIKINSVRKALNMLAEKGLISYRRIRVVDKNGRSGVTFYWKINPENLKSFIESRKKAVIDKLKTLLEHEESTYYYVCPLDGTRYTLDEAMEYNFTCPRCGSMLVPDEERELRIEVLRTIIRRLEKEYAG